jgi:hypothetical protein
VKKLKPLLMSIGGGAALGTQEEGAATAAEELALEHGHEFVGFSGSSVGAALSVPRAFGIGPADRLVLLKELLRDNAMLDFSLQGLPGGGITKWEVLEEWTAKIIGRHTTFGAAPKDLCIAVTSADEARPFYFSKKLTPRVKVCEVIGRTSAFLLGITDMDTIPSYGTTMTPDIRLWYDAGYTDNTCDDVWDKRSCPRVGIRLHRGGIQRVVKGDFKAMLQSKVRALTHAANEWKTKRSDGLNVSLDVVYDTGFDFSKDAAQVDREWQLGYDQMQQHKAWFAALPR